MHIRAMFANIYWAGREPSTSVLFLIIGMFQDS